MPTDDERREVARRLRGQAKMLGPNMDAHEFAHYTADVIDVNECMTWYEMELRLADLMEPARGSGGRAILCAHCESMPWCGCEPGDLEGGCDFEPSVTEGEPPYNLYTLYEAVFHRSPRCRECIEDDEVDELVDALLDICNAPGHEHIQRPQPDEPQVKRELKYRSRCDELGAEMKRQRDALLKLADEIDSTSCDKTDGELTVDLITIWGWAQAIRDALGVE